VDFAEAPADGRKRRLIERTRHVYWSDDLQERLPLGVAGFRAFERESQRAALTPQLIAQVYGGKVPDAAALRQLVLEAKYVEEDGLWWASSGETAYDPARFYQPVQFADPFGATSRVTYDTHALLVEVATSAVGTPLETTTTVENDYRVLGPALVVDSNGNRSRVVFDALGRVSATITMGKEGEPVGDDPEHPTTRIEYHLEALPAYIYTESREQHWQAVPTNSKIQRTYVYTDGLGRDVLTKNQANRGRTARSAGSAQAGPSSITKGTRSRSTSRISATPPSTRWSSRGSPTPYATTRWAG
jgi:YD repeat-containing protein